MPIEVLQSSDGTADVYRPQLAGVLSSVPLLRRGSEHFLHGRKPETGNASVVRVSLSL